MAEMTAKELLALVQEYAALWENYDAWTAPATLYGTGIPWTNNPKVIGYFERLQAIENQITGQGFALWHDGQQKICLYLPGKTPDLDEDDEEP